MNLELIIMVGVIWNAVLQTIWFIWSIKVHTEKHLEDETQQTSRTSKTPRTPKTQKTAPVVWNDVIPKTREEVLNTEKRYNPDEIQGAFDDFFQEPSEENIKKAINKLNSLD